jgi:hypothetical protein
MPGNTVRYGATDPGEPIVHELPPLRYQGALVPVYLEVRREDDGTWRGRLIFGPTEDTSAPATAEIFCAASEAELWDAVRDLRDHHQRDLYRSIVE